MYCATLPRACTGVLVCWLAPCWLAGVVLTASRAARRLSARLSARAATQLSARGPLRGNDGPLRGGGVGPLRGSQLTTVFTTCAATRHCGNTAVQSSFLKPRGRTQQAAANSSTLQAQEAQARRYRHAIHSHMLTGTFVGEKSASIELPSEVPHGQPHVHRTRAK